MNRRIATPRSLKLQDSNADSLKAESPTPKSQAVFTQPGPIPDLAGFDREIGAGRIPVIGRCVRARRDSARSWPPNDLQQVPASGASVDDHRSKRLRV